MPLNVVSNYAANVAHRNLQATDTAASNSLAKLSIGKRVVSCQMYLPMPPRYTTLADFFNPLVNHIEQMVLTGDVPYPVERTLLTSGMTLAGVDSLHRRGEKVETPEMHVAYQPHRESAFWRK